MTVQGDTDYNRALSGIQTGQTAKPMLLRTSESLKKQDKNLLFIKFSPTFGRLEVSSLGLPLECSP